MALTSIPSQGIRKFICSINNRRSQGSDGCSSGFFKHSWNVISSELCSFIQDIFKTTLPSKIKDIYIVLIPKKSLYSCPGDYQPTSHTNVIYIVITKLIVNHLKTILAKLIHPCQSAFIPGRQILRSTALVAPFLPPRGHLILSFY